MAGAALLYYLAALHSVAMTTVHAVSSWTVGRRKCCAVKLTPSLSDETSSLLLCHLQTSFFARLYIIVLVEHCSYQLFNEKSVFN